MSEVLWPPDIIPSSQSWRVIGNVGAFQSPLNGAVRTVARNGARFACTVTVPPLKGQNRARLVAVLGALRDRSNRIWMPDFSTTPRGSLSTPELFSNNDFSNGTNSWTAQASTLSASDRVLRVKPTQGGGTQPGVFQAVTLTQYVPYSLRALAYQLSGRGNTISPFVSDGAVSYSAGSSGTAMRSLSMVPPSTAALNMFPAYISDAAWSVDDFFEVAWSSAARCALVDNSPNAIANSDAADTWSPSGLASVAANSASQTDPFGTTTAEKLTENTSNSAHYVLTTGPTITATADYCGVVYARRDTLTRDVSVVLGTTGSGHYGQCNYDLGAGTAGSTSVGGSATNARAFIRSLGNQWYACFLIVRLPTSAVRADLQVMMVSGGAVTYTGSTGTLMIVRGGVAQSSVPFLPGKTTGTISAGAAQTGQILNVKGLPASTNGLRLAGDPVQVGGQINFLKAPLDSDSTGRGVMHCLLPWRPSIADNDPVFFNTPMAKMMIAEDSVGWDTGPGQFSSFSLDLIEDVT